MALTMDLSVRVHREVMVLRDKQNVDLILRNYAQVVAVTNNFPNVTQHGLQGFLGPLDDRGELSLEQAEDLLTRWSWEPTLDSDRVSAIRDQLKDLRGAVESAGLELGGFDVDYLLRVLDEVDIALAAYRIAGIAVVEEGLDAAIGQLRRRPNLLVKLMKNKTGKALIALLSAVSVLLADAQGIKELAAGDPSTPPEIVNNVTVTNENAGDVFIELVHDPATGEWAMPPKPKEAARRSFRRVPTGRISPSLGQDGRLMLSIDSL